MITATKRFSICKWTRFSKLFGVERNVKAVASYQKRAKENERHKIYNRKLWSTFNIPIFFHSILLSLHWLTIPILPAIDHNIWPSFTCSAPVIKRINQLVIETIDKFIMFCLNNSMRALLNSWKLLCRVMNVSGSIFMFPNIWKSTI